MTVVQYSARIKKEKELENKGANVIDELKNLSLDECREYQKKSSFPFHVMALNIDGDLNIGTIGRAACLNGAEKFYIFGRRRADKRGLVGAQHYLDVERVHGLLPDQQTIDVEAFNSFVQERSLFPLIVEKTDNSVCLTKVNFVEVFSDKKLLIVFGNESDGVPEKICKTYPCISIPQVGVLRSFNVSNAAAIVMWEMRRQMSWF